MTRSQILDKIRQAGVVGAGGAGFPAHIKCDADADTVIVNGVECEPLLRVDRELMLEKTEEVITGLKAVMKVTGASKGIIALKKKYTAAIAAIGEKIKNNTDIEIFQLADIYPAGDEQVLVYEVTGKIVPEGGIPLMVGTVVINVETLCNISRALQDMPVVDKFVTVTGAVNSPVTLKVQVGSQINTLISRAGGSSLDSYAIIRGGPMMGEPVSANDRIDKTTKGIIVLPESHNLIKRRNYNIKFMLKRSMSVCCQCRACTDVCPRFLLGHNLEPHKIMRSIAYGLERDSDIITRAMLCSECGVCEIWGCPMGLSPKNVNKEIKEELIKQGYSIDNHHSPDRVHKMREYRKIPGKRLIKRLGISKWNKEAALSDRKIATDQVEMSLKQHIGVPAVPEVSPGQKVKRGEIIASIPDNKVGAVIHSSINGKVSGIGESITIEAG